MAQAGVSAAEKQPSLPKFDVQAIVQTNAFRYGVIFLIGLTAMYWQLFSKLPDLWNSPDGYYSHGWLVPLISGYVVYRWWPRIKDIPIKPNWFALLPMVPMAFLFYAGTRIQQIQIISVTFVVTLLCGIWFVAGFRWMLALLGPVLYLLFMLPIWSAAIDTYTNPLQVISSEVAFGMLQLLGLEPLRDGTTTIHLEQFVLDVGIPCSGLKLVLAVTAFTCFFVMIGRLKWWGNLTMFVSILPLCLFINGLRIALIGVVGNMYGEEAGHQFHDYSGYITLLICFFLLFKLARMLGWKD